MHMDAVAARRLLSGRQIVHGIHTLICALDLWSGATAGPLQLNCNFANPVNVGDLVVFNHFVDAGGRVRLVASVDGLVCTEITIDTVSPDLSVIARSAVAPAVLQRIDTLAAPLDETPGSQVGDVIEIEAWPDPLAEQYPRAAALLGPQGLSALARLSFYVGMVCPGLHSVFSSVQFTTSTVHNTTLIVEVRKYDPRFRLFTVAFSGALAGELRAFLRPPPQPQPRMDDMLQRLSGQEFRGTRSLVVGGSRGLGETTAKLIAAGGGEVAITYARGQADAELVVAEINAAGRGSCRAAALDLQGRFDGAPGIEPTQLDAVYFFATPRIYVKRSEVFDRAAFDEFATFYLQRFHELCRWLDRHEREQPLMVYLPSTVFISERPKGMTEYAMVKAAAEVLAEDLNRNLRNVRVLHTRLPRLATDQTASILKVPVESNLDVMLAVVRQMTTPTN